MVKGGQGQYIKNPANSDKSDFSDNFDFSSFYHRIAIKVWKCSSNNYFTLQIFWLLEEPFVLKPHCYALQVELCIIESKLPRFYRPTFYLLSYGRCLAKRYASFSRYETDLLASLLCLTSQTRGIVLEPDVYFSFFFSFLKSWYGSNFGR